MPQYQQQNAARGSRPKLTRSVRSIAKFMRFSAPPTLITTRATHKNPRMRRNSAHRCERPPLRPGNWTNLSGCASAQFLTTIRFTVCIQRRVLPLEALYSRLFVGRHLCDVSQQLACNAAALDGAAVIDQNGIVRGIGCISRRDEGNRRRGGTNSCCLVRVDGWRRSEDRPGW